LFILNAQSIKERKTFFVDLHEPEFIYRFQV
jgi:hypothetical protein